MLIAISYDIVDNKKRYRLSKILSNFGARVQKSVFECQIDDNQFLKMKTQIEKVIDHKEDSVRYYFLCGRCEKNIEISGWGTVREDEDIIVV